MKSKLSLLLLLLCLFLCSCESTKVLPVGSTAADISTSSPETSATPETIRWHLDIQTDRTLETISIPIELSEYVIKVPLKYAETVDNIEFTVNFFQEYYQLGGFIQMRITANNNNGNDINYQGDSSYGIGIFYRNDGSMQSLSMSAVNLEQAAYFSTDVVKYEVMKAGETTVYERAARADPDFFKPNNSYSFLFGIGDSIIEIPIEVVKRN